MTKPKIAAFGIRTLPPAEGCGGAETFAEELYTRLNKSGYDVTVYAKKLFGDKRKKAVYKNLNVIYLPTVKQVGIDTFLHSFLCALHIIFFNTGKIIHIHNAGNSLFVPLLRIFGKKCFISMDGIDWNRTRWNKFARIYLRLTNFIAFFVANKVIVDNKIVQEYYSKKYINKTDYVPYGSNIVKINTSSALEKLGVEKNKYLLFTGRFSIEKGIHYLIKAFEQIQSDYKLVLIGDDLYNKAWVSDLKSTNDKRIIFTGFLYGADVDELMQHCYLYVQPSDVEGLSPVILRVMGLGKCVLSSDIPENTFLVKNNGYLFKHGNIASLKSEIEKLLNNKDSVDSAGEKSLKFVKENYSWDKITRRHIDIFNNN
jgi:glycosyltransferase involved in cell wall biosynthesis